MAVILALILVSSVLVTVYVDLDRVPVSSGEHNYWRLELSASQNHPYQGDLAKTEVVIHSELVDLLPFEEDMLYTGELRIRFYGHMGGEENSGAEFVRGYVDNLDSNLKIYWENAPTTTTVSMVDASGILKTGENLSLVFEVENSDYFMNVTKLDILQIHESGFRESLYSDLVVDSGEG